MHRSNRLPVVTREMVEAAAALEDSRNSNAPKLLRDLRCAYELILDHKHTRLRVMEVARAIQEAASATPPAFSPGGSRGTTPGYGRTGRYSSNISHSSHSQSPTAALSPAQQARLAEETTRALMHPGSHSPSSHTNTPPPVGAGSNVQRTTSIPGNGGMIEQHQNQRRTRRWYLGIQSKKDPAHVMTEVYKALSALGCEWMLLSSYRIRCRWRPHAGKEEEAKPVQRSQSSASMEIDMDTSTGPVATEEKKQEGGDDRAMKITAPKGREYVPVPNLSTPDYTIKIGLTLYKVQQNIYLLDFQKLTGDAFSFMTLCANIITELKALSAASKQAAMFLAQQQAQAARFAGGPVPHHP